MNEITSDVIDLPNSLFKRNEFDYPQENKPFEEQKSNQLTDQQKTMMIAGGIDIFKSGAEIAKQLIEIKKIKANTDSTVEVIKAKTQAVEKLLKYEINKIIEERENIKTRSEACVLIIKAITSSISENIVLRDTDKRALIDQIPILIEKSLANNSVKSDFIV